MIAKHLWTFEWLLKQPGLTLVSLIPLLCLPTPTSLHTSAGILLTYLGKGSVGGNTHLLSPALSLCAASLRVFVVVE